MTHTMTNPKPTKAIILSAGQGRRLLPLTGDTPKCLLSVADKPVIAWQIDALIKAGIDSITIVGGFQIGKVEALIAQRYAAYPEIRVRFNPFYEVADNLASCWIVRDRMENDFVLINGDTLFETALVSQVLQSDYAPITLSVDYKETFDEDDMKVELGTDKWVRHVSKLLTPQQSHAESIGFIYFRDEGTQLFRNAVEQALRDPRKLKSWYLTIIDQLAGQHQVNSRSVQGFKWCEIDFIEDLQRAKQLFASPGCLCNGYQQDKSSNHETIIPLPM